MTEIESREVKKVIIHNIERYTFEEFQELKAGYGAVGWIDGVYFNIGYYPPNDEILHDAIHNDIMHWTILEYCYGDYKKEITSSRNLKSEVLKRHTSKVLRDAVEYVKKLDGINQKQ